MSVKWLKRPLHAGEIVECVAYIEYVGMIDTVAELTGNGEPDEASESLISCRTLAANGSLTQAAYTYVEDVVPLHDESDEEVASWGV